MNNSRLASLMVVFLELATGCQPANAGSPPLGSLGQASVAATAQPSPPPAAVAPAPTLVAASPSAGVPMMAAPDFASVAQKVLPAVVSIKVQQKALASAGRDDEQNPFRFFGMMPPGFRMPAPMPRGGLGSGFVIGQEGIILTNNHVIEDADTIEVTFQRADGTEETLPAKVIGKAPDYDVALLKTDTNAKAAVLELGDSDAVKVGQWVMAVGNPYGLSQSVSVGIISAKDRADIAPNGRRGIYDFLQTDASINPGNSGGPLVDMSGRVVGMNTAIHGEGTGIGFAIPSNMIRNMLSDLRTRGRFARSWIGVKIQGLTPELAQSYGLKDEKGALVAEVVPNSPAADAGLKEGDIIRTFDGRPIQSSDQLPLWAGMTGAGKTVQLTILRDGREKTVGLKLGEFPEDEATVAQATPGESGSLGFAIGDVTPKAQEALGLSDRRGAVVKEVAPDGAAARVGIRPGDVVVSAQGQRIENAAALRKIVQDAKSGELLRLRLIRNGEPLFVAVKKP